MELSVETKRSIINSRIQKLAEDNYNLELNYKFAIEQKNESAIEKYKEAVLATKTSLEFHEKELALLDI